MTLRRYARIPKYLELLWWFLTFSFLTAACEAIVRIPFDLTLGIINSIRQLLGRPRLAHSSLYSCLLVVGFYVGTRDWRLFSVSFLYHSFRGQSSVKLYGVGLALEISEKLLTMMGISLLSKLHSLRREQGSRVALLSVEMGLCLGYTLLHFFSL